MFTNVQTICCRVIVVIILSMVPLEARQNRGMVMLLLHQLCCRLLRVLVLPVQHLLHSSIGRVPPGFHLHCRLLPVLLSVLLATVIAIDLQCHPTVVLHTLGRVVDNNKQMYALGISIRAMGPNKLTTPALLHWCCYLWSEASI